MHLLLRMRSAASTKCKGELAQALILHRGEVLEAPSEQSDRSVSHKSGDSRAERAGLPA
jgi:hypothetical protein